VFWQLTPDAVCTKHGLNNVNIDYTDENFRQWTSYKLYADHVRPMVLRENPKVSMTRLVQLIAAKWREFDSLNPYNEQSHGAVKKVKEGLRNAAASCRLFSSYFQLHLVLRGHKPGQPGILGDFSEHGKLREFLGNSVQPRGKL